MYSEQYSVQVYSDRLEVSEDRMARWARVLGSLVTILIFISLRHAIAGDVVMLSHLAMKLFYVKMDTEQMEGEADL